MSDPMARPARASADVETSDAELVRLALERDERAWRVLVDRFSRLVYSIPRRSGLPADACDDVFQNVFAIIHKELKSLRDVVSLPKWIITTTTRETWRVGRKLRAGQGIGAAESEGRG